MTRPSLAAMLLMLVISSSHLSCRFLRAEADFQIKVINASGEAIAHAQIVIHKIPRGKSDEEGKFKIALALPIDEPILIEINKPSTELFYAPFFSSIKLQRGEPNSFKIQATLFAVPKNISLLPTKPELPTENETSQESLAKPDLSASPPSESPDHQDLTLTSPLVLDQNTPINASQATLAPSDKPLESGPTSANAETFDLESNIQKAADNLLGSNDQNSRLITFYIAGNHENIADAQILFGDPDQGQWMEGCKSNVRGRCSLTLPAHFTTDNVHLLIRANGFQSQTKIISLAHGDKVRVDLQRGFSLEIFALRKTYRTVRGLAGVKIKLDSKELGATNNFGYFVHSLPPNLPESPIVVMEAANQLPAKISHTISSNKSNTLVQSFSTLQPPKARLLLLPLKIQAEGSDNPIPSNVMNWDRLIQNGLKQYFINQAPFTEADQDRVTTLLEKNGKSLFQIARQGWSQADLQAEFEWALRPLLILGPQAALELSIIDAEGNILAASIQRLTSKPDAKTLRGLLSRAAREMATFLPFEGSLVASDKQGFQVNFSQQAGHQIQSGETLRIHSLQTEAIGMQGFWSDIGTATISELNSAFARVQLSELSSKTAIGVGQTVVLNRLPQKGDRQIIIRDQNDQHPLAQANIYLQERWIGVTDRRGIAHLSTKSLAGRGLLQIVRPGYRIQLNDYTATNLPNPIFLLQRSAFPVRVESEPSGAQVKINGRLLGRTPIYQSLDISGATAQIEVQLSEEFKIINQIVSIDEEGIDWSGVRAVHLEKDIRREARELIKLNQLSEAIGILEALGESHPDFLLVQHELGDIYLNQLQDPLKAASAYHRVTKQENVANFTDKRFIGTHINEAIAIYHSGDKIKDNDPSAAISAWQKARDILDRCEDQLRFIPQEQYTQALHSLSFYRALSLHHIWGKTQKNSELLVAHAAWKKYIETATIATPQDKFYSMIKKAEHFYRQTQQVLEPQEQASIKQPAPAAQAM